MIDFHNHILPGVDDGPTNDNEMIELIKQAKSEGASGIVVTPHHLHTKYNNTIDYVEKQLDRINDIEIIRELDINFYAGQEIRISDEILTEIDEGNIKGINQSRYLLIEFPSNEVPHYTERLFYELQIKGFIPIIAHPERNKAISKDMSILYNLINKGALSQLTASSLIGTSGKKVKKLAIKMLDNNLAHFIGSDAHNVKTRPFVLKKLKSEKSLKKYHQDIDICFKNIELMIEDKKILRKMPTEIHQKNKWFKL
ncbi:CpsB/CapC family capsule biosynthesis tyrosine phosphatase [Staphylococcus warneri]|uniref:tyrosine-protein phosphatase n=1 Tax=Staphylococcus warneri TaxID=1292 RepID=UPI0032610D9A